MKNRLDGFADGRAVAAHPRRVVLLGASNLTKGIGTVMETARRLWGRPLTVFGALGHGRSYGRASSILGRQLPGILECGLWESLAQAPAVPTAALLTDVGNDLLYEEPVDELVGWLRTCLDRLVAIEARTVVTLLPVENLESLSRGRFLLMRKLFFPHSRISLEEVGRRAHAVNDALARMATDRGMTVARHRPVWYGFDPIHIRLKHRASAWREILASWSDSIDPSGPVRASVRSTLYLRSRVPERRRLLGFEQHARQPAGQLHDGTTVAIY